MVCTFGRLIKGTIMTKTQLKAAQRLAKNAARQSTTPVRTYAILEDGTVEMIKRSR